MNIRLCYLIIFSIIGSSSFQLLAKQEVEMPEIDLKADTDTSLKNSSSDSSTFLSSYTHPWEFGDPTELLEFNFENAELSSLISYIEKKYGITFLLDDDISPLPAGGKSVKGIKISYRTHRPLSKKEAWAIFVTFLDMAGLAPVPGPDKKTYKIVSTDPKSPSSSTKSPLPTYIGTDLELIPTDNTRIRYVYFVENTSLQVIQNLLDQFKSPTAPALVTFPDLRAIVMTDKAANIQSLIGLIRELDKTNMPEMLSVLPLKHTDAVKVAELYASLVKEEGQQTLAARLLGGRKQQTTAYFSDATRVIPEPRTNTLILLGTKESVTKIIDFVKNEVDKESRLPTTPIYTYQPKHLDAEALAAILNEITAFQKETEAAKAGGVRDGDKYFKPLNIVAEKTGNRLIINADYEDRAKIVEFLNKIDIEQPQVAIKVLVLSIDITDERAFGVQLRNKFPGPNGLLTDNVNFQTSGLAGLNSSVVENPNGTGASRLLGDLINLVTGNPAGSTLVTLGCDAFGVWGMLKMLQTYTQLTTEANPFVVATHKYQSTIAIGTTRRVTSATVGTQPASTSSFEDISANLEVKLTPQISVRDGLITMDIVVTLDQFTDVTDQNSGNRTTRMVQTSVIVGNNETLALGGLIRETITEVDSKVPVLGDIPILGWAFKNKDKTLIRESLVILITPEIIPPKLSKEADRFTASKLKEARSVADEMSAPTAAYRDPIHRWFFNDKREAELNIVESGLADFIRRNESYQKEQEKARANEELAEILAPKKKKSRSKKRSMEKLVPEEKEADHAT